MADKKYGWYSSKQYQYGYWMCKTIDDQTVCVTWITPDQNHGTRWDDICFIGEIKEVIHFYPNEQEQIQKSQLKIDMRPREPSIS